MAMHQLLPAIGFGSIKSKKQIYQILDRMEIENRNYERICLEEDIDFVEYSAEFADGIGIMVNGDMDVNGDILEQWTYYPYLYGSQVSSCAPTTVEKRTDQDSFVGICEDSRVGVSLMFHVLNVADYLKACQKHMAKAEPKSVSFSALANHGTILLPVMKNEDQAQEQKKDVENRRQLLNAAKSGDQLAIESLTLDDIDTYSQVAMRLTKEDIFSIVETSFMPMGFECDKYTILGTIMELDRDVNVITGEELYIMQLEINEMLLDLCVPAAGLAGEPAVGRRFRGNIWLQGWLTL